MITNEDNIELMKRYPDNFFDWACIDPPYGLDKKLSNGAGKMKNSPFKCLYKNKNWDFKPSNEYWENVFRVSKNQIIFGANYFLEYLPSTRGFVCWDKKQSMPTFSQCELIWTSLDKPSKIAKYSSMDLERFHPTQKPVEIYEFMFNYCKIKKNSKILDTHLGSGSSAIACLNFELELTACELDIEYFNKSINRINKHKRQMKLF